ncbi:MAG: PEP-CTERM sorting domain-containing protein [Deltaproteobacteria bacterium]|nr:PEP-CTERM sorting domain-containing protein [Deltaproteobacteria bacterium]
MKKISFISGVLLSVLLAGSASAVTVDGDFDLVEWAGHYSAEDGVGPGGSVGPGVGGQSFDVEYLGLEFTPGGKLYFGLQTGFNMIDNVYSGGAWYYPGDFGLNIDSDPFYEYAIKSSFSGTTPSYTLWEATTWQDVKYSAHMAATPYKLKTGTQVDGVAFTGAYGTTTTNIDGGLSYILEGSLDLSDLTLYSGGPITLHWTMNCGNDYLNHTSEPESVPEPGTLLLMGAGLAGLGAWRFRKKSL